MKIIIHRSCYIDAWIIYRIVRERTHSSHHHSFFFRQDTFHSFSIMYKNSGLLCENVEQLNQRFIYLNWFIY